MPIRHRIARIAIATVAAALALGAGPGVEPRNAQAAPDVEVWRVPDGGLQPQVAVDREGIVHLVYFTGEAARGDLWYVRRPPKGTFSAPIKVNSAPRSAIAVGNVRGARVALGRRGRLHVVWNGSDEAQPRAAGGATPMLYTRSNSAGTAFEPQRNLLQHATTLDGGGAVAADDRGRVYVTMHGNTPGEKSEADRHVWVAESIDDGANFSRETPISGATGACGCCGMAASATSAGGLFVLYRSARDLVHRDTYLLHKWNPEESGSRLLQEWNIGACPMTMFAFLESQGGLLAAWETAGQVQFARIDPKTGVTQDKIEAPGSARTRKHPALAVNSRGDVLLAWTEGMGWQRGGSVAWQVFDKAGRPTSVSGRAPGVPAWSLVAALTRAGGGFAILY